MIIIQNDESYLDKGKSCTVMGGGRHGCRYRRKGSNVGVCGMFCGLLRVYA